MEYILQNTLLALLEYPDTTLLDVNRMLTNKSFRHPVVEQIQDPIVKGFWTEEFAAFTDTYTREATPAIQNKVGQFTANPLIRNIVGQGKSSFDLRKMMDEKKIFIVNLSKGRMGETNAALLGSMLVVKIYLAAMSRADEPASRMAALPRFYFYVDEFQSMMNEAFADILSESRKYKLALTLANQYIEQMEEEVRDAVFGNVGTLICFRVGPFDAEVLETVFMPTFTPEDLVGLGIGQIYLTLMIDGVGSIPFSAETIPPIDPPPVSYRDDVIRASRAQFARARTDIEASVLKRQQDFALPPRGSASGGGGPRERYQGPAARPRGDNRAGGRFTPPSRGPRDGEPRHTASPEPSSQKAQTDRGGIPSTVVRPREEGERSALRAAIAAAHPPEPAASSVRSPADILRERLARKSQPSSSSQGTAVERGVAKGAKEADQRPQPHPVMNTQISVPHGAAKDERNGEVSREELERVLRGRSGSEE